MNDPLVLKIDSALENLEQVRRFIDRAADELDVDPDTVSDIRLAVDEAVTNIIVHGYRGDHGKIEVEMRREGDALQVYLRDTAELFDPLNAPAPDLTAALEDRPVGGMGVHLMRTVMDQTRYRVTPDRKNELMLAKQAAAPC